MVIMVFSMNAANTKLVTNFLIFFVLKFYHHMPDGLRVMNLRSLLLGSACILNRSE
jgi:hypothetical protein